MTQLSFSTLRAANIARLPLFKNSRGLPAHSRPDGSDWSLGEWMNAILGELGEAANLVKKVKRGDMPLEAARSELAKELADVVTYADITAMRMDIAFNFYPDFATMRSTKSDFYAVNFDLSLGEWMNKSFGWFGTAASVVDETYRQSAAPIVTRWYFHNALIAIDCAANSIGVDLASEVINKFNFVSRRVGANVYIIDDEVNFGGGPL